MDERTNERGFTLIELMLALGVLAVIVKLAVPMFSSESRKVKADSEVATMFAELANREEQFHGDTGSYLAAAACPSTSVAAGSDPAPCLATGSAWNTMHVTVHSTTLACSYQITAGTAASSAPSIPTGLTFTMPPQSWYFILATCNTDGKSPIDSLFFTSSVDSSIQKLNPGN